MLRATCLLLFTSLWLSIPGHAAGRRHPAKAVARRPAASGAAHASRRGARVAPARFRGHGNGRIVATRHGYAVRGRQSLRFAAAPTVIAPNPSERAFASSFNATPGYLTAGDVTAGEDPVVRAAAIEALGNLNGTALAIDPSSGRILAMVNQRLALSAGAEPCSTIKVSVALAALKEGLVTANTPVNLGGHYALDLTTALARSVNLYFEVLGRAMGFERIKHYANEFGLGELAGYGIQGEQLGVYPDTELPHNKGGVGRMCSFGESISMTPLQLGALVSAIANGGTLYYLQHPTTSEAAAEFTPRVKRLLDIQNVIPQIMPGMAGAVNFGTARSLHANFEQFPVLGKTGTCSNNGVHFGWFVSYGDSPTGRIVTVIFLDGSRGFSGPRAAEVTGQFYRAMYERNYFAPHGPAIASTHAATGQ